MTRILALCGSLRARSSNAAVLRVAALVAATGIVIDIHPGLDALPYFNPDLDREFDDPCLPGAVQALRRGVADADALLLSSPEYAHGISGLMKNALDWLVGGAEMVDKPVGVINTSPHASHALNAMIETLRTMTANVIETACIAIQLPRDATDAELAAQPEVVNALRSALGHLSAEKQERRWTH